MINIEWDTYTRVQLLQFLIMKNQYKTYLEIGCDKNQVFDNVSGMTVKEGVDPKRGGTLRMTSDQFFAQDNRRWDLIFIDGLHEYAQVSRDVYNALDRLNDNGTIVIHDMLPTRETQAGPTPMEKYWLGDVWYLGFDLMSRSDLHFKIFNFDFGCGIITKQPQTPITVPNKANKWEFYQNNFNKLPITTFKEYFNA